MNDAVELLLPLAAHESVSLEADVVDPGRVLCDRDQIGRVLSNLISNAIKFTPAGGRVTVRAARIGAGVRLCVSDTGIGISKEDHQDLRSGFQG